MNTPVDVLVIEDSPTVRQQIVGYLTPRNFVVREADSMVKAMTLIIERQPDVALLDIGLPDTAGADSVAILHRFCKEIAIVAFTGESDQEIALECAKAGAVDFISKAGRSAFLDDVATRIRLAKYSGGRLEKSPVDLHDSVQKRIDKLIAKIPNQTKR